MPMTAGNVSFLPSQQVCLCPDVCTTRLIKYVRLTVETSHSLTVVIDSLDTLLSNLHSKAAVYTFLTQLLSAIRTRPSKPIRRIAILCST